MIKTLAIKIFGNKCEEEIQLTLTDFNGVVELTPNHP